MSGSGAPLGGEGRAVLGWAWLLLQGTDCWRKGKNVRNSAVHTSVSREEEHEWMLDFSGRAGWGMEGCFWLPVAATLFCHVCLLPTKAISNMYCRYEQKALKILQYFKLCDSLPALTEVFPV